MLDLFLDGMTVYGPLVLGLALLLGAGACRFLSAC